MSERVTVDIDEFTGGYDYPDTGVLDHLRSIFQKNKPKGPYDHILEGRKRINPIEFAKDFKKRTNFKAEDEDLVSTEDPYEFTRVLPDGTIETTLEKYEDVRKKTGQNEALSYGIGKVGKKAFVELVFNWDFLAATSGAVVGEKFMRAMDLATERNLPVVVLYSSGGQRQQEAAAALIEMLRTTYVIDQFKQKTNQPIISVLVGNVWGGISASGVPMGDVVIGMAGTDFGFAGRPVIKSSEGELPPLGAQTVENTFLTNRKVHMILNTQDELLEVLDKTFSILDENDKVIIKSKRRKETTGLNFDGHGFKTPLRPERHLRRHPRAKIQLGFEPKIFEAEDVYAQYKEVLSKDPRRPDTLYTLQHGFDKFVPLFSGEVTEDRGDKYLKYPGIIAALAAIDDPRLPDYRLRAMVIGNQPGYLRQEDGNIWKIHASPTAWDYRYQLKMIEYAQRLKLPVITFTDTFGAKPSINEELAAQYDAIADCLIAQTRYPYLTMGYIIGVLGSGGGLATTFRSRYVAQLSGAQEYVAPPEAAANIVYKDPKEADVIRTTEGMKPLASFSLGRGLIDRVIQEPLKGAQGDPLSAVLSIREDIIQTYLEYSKLSTEELMDLQDYKLRGLKAIKVGPLGAASRSPVFNKILARILHSSTAAEIY